MVLSQLSGWVLQVILVVFRFHCIKKGNAVESENYSFLLSLYTSGVIPGVFCGSQSTQWLVSAGFSWGSPFSMYHKGEMLSNLKIMDFCYICTCWGFSWGLSVVLSPRSGWVLQGSLGGSPFLSASNGRNAVQFENYGFGSFCTCLGFSRGFSVVISPLCGWVLQGSLGGFHFSVYHKGTCCRI